MTTRTRRNARQQTEAIWKKLLVKQEAEVDKRFAALQDAQAKLYKTRQVLAALGEEETPEESPKVVYSPRPLYPYHMEGSGDDLSQPLNNTATTASLPPLIIEEAENQIVDGKPTSLPVEEGGIPPDPPIRPHRQKAQGINDVWNAKEGVVTVHSALMYTRQDACEWCEKGVPFTTEERTHHHVTIAYSDGVERGFMPELCTGEKEQHDKPRNRSV